MSEYKINLIKEREQKVKVSLEKKTKEKIICEVNLILDASPSMDHEYRSGKVQEVVERIFPIASNFSPTKKLGMFVFSSDSDTLEPMTIDNFIGYVKDKIFDKGYIRGGTTYAPVISYILNSCPRVGFIQSIKNFFRKLFKKEVVVGKPIPVFNIFITDGDNSDHYETERLIKNGSDKHHFWQFVGIGRSSFTFLSRLDDMEGRFLDNADFIQLNDIADISDEKLYDLLLNEFPGWLREARNKNII
jgi:hypothetical protein